MRAAALVFFLIVTVVLSLLSIIASVSDRFYFFLAKIWSRTFLFLFRANVTLIDKRRSARRGGFVYCANHSSYTDIPVLLGTVDDELRLVLRSNLTRIPIWGWALKLSPMISIDRTNPIRSRRTLTRAVEKIRRGKSILLFPEGTRSADGKLGVFKRGAFHIAFQSTVPIVPIAIRGTYDMLPRHQKLPKFSARITVMIGDPITADHTIPDQRMRERDLMQRTHNAIAQMLVENH
jgi:1-acyl-sn-glycerol-3-phosphate acyltransferase